MRKLVQSIVLLVFLAYLTQVSSMRGRVEDEKEVMVIKKHRMVKSFRQHHRERRPRHRHMDMDDYEDLGDDESRNFRRQQLREREPDFMPEYSEESYHRQPRHHRLPRSAVITESEPNAESLSNLEGHFL